MPRVDFVITKSNLILSSVLFSACLLRLTLAACRSRTDGWWHSSSALSFWAAFCEQGLQENTTVPLSSVLWFGNGAYSCGTLKLPSKVHCPSVTLLVTCMAFIAATNQPTIYLELSIIKVSKLYFYLQQQPEGNVIGGWMNNTLTEGFPVQSISPPYKIYYRV